MEMMIERRGDLEGRVPLHLPIELEFDGLPEPFEADAVDVSTGGLSLRTSCLPEVGTPLSCRFEVIPGGARIDAQGQVVWTRLDGPDGGEFGVRFVELEPEDRALIAEMIAEQEMHHAMSLAASAPPASSPPMPGKMPQAPQTESSEKAGVPHVEVQSAVIALDESAAEIEGRLAERGPLGARFEQPLDLLSVGQGLWLHAEDGRSRRAQIASVSLRLEGKTPLLAVQVEFDEGQASVHGLSWEEQEGDPMRDTVPDLMPPEVVLDDASSAQQRRTEVEFVFDEGAQSAPRMARATHNAGAVREPLLGQAPATEDADTRVHGRTLEEAISGAAVAQPTAVSSSNAAVAEDPARVHPVRPAEVPVSAAEPAKLQPAQPAHAVQLAPATARPDVSMSFELPDLEDEFEQEEAPSWPRLHLPKTPSVSGAQFRAALKNSPLFQEGGAGLMLVAHFARLTVQARAFLSSTWSFLRSSAVPALGAVFAIGASKLRVQARHKPRRRTAGKAQPASQAPSNALPLALIAVLACSAIALLAYALWPEKDPLLTAPSAAVMPAPAPAAAAPLLPQALPEPARAQEPEVESVPTPGTVPSGSPYATTKSQLDAARAQAAGPSFGASRLKNPTRFALRMNGPIEDLKGTPDPGGFSVRVTGARSLDKAGPLASRHKALAKTAIINSGSHADLKVRFVPGKQPKYRVSTDGSTLVIEVENK